MPVDKIRVEGDSRIEYKSAIVNGHKYCQLIETSILFFFTAR